MSETNVGYAGCAMNEAGRLTEDECFILTHISHFGSEGYPITRTGSRRWSWEYRGHGCPVTFPTKKQAVRSFEQHLDILRDKLAGRIGTLHGTMPTAQQLGAEPFEDD